MSLRLLTCLLAFVVASPCLAQLPSPPVDTSLYGDEGQLAPQPLDHGPIHEAFAEPYSYDATEQFTVDQLPPEPVEEVPPQVQPEGNNVEWIPGYWMWETELNDFIWVSGVWRDVPPGRVWVPGSWVQADNGYQWSPGFWSTGELTHADYLPYPPESLEQGPTSVAPTADAFWIPGCWRWQDNRYAWRPGYWYAGKENWVWSPSHYLYTPRGCLYVQGYWDYPLANRGLLYAPVYWGNNGYRRGYAYRPYNVIDTTLLLSSLFVDRGYRSYYYGGHHHYRDNNRYRPWYRATRYSGNRGYDPLLAYHAWNHGRNQRDWSDQVRRRYDPNLGPHRDDRRGDQRDQRRGDGRPDRDWEGDRGRNGNRNGFRDQNLVRRLDQLEGTDLANVLRNRGQAGDADRPGRTRPRPEARNQADSRKQIDRMRDYARKREKLETGGRPPQYHHTAKPTEEAEKLRRGNAQRRDPFVDSRGRMDALRNGQRAQDQRAQDRGAAKDLRRNPSERDRSTQSLENLLRSKSPKGARGSSETAPNRRSFDRRSLEGRSETLRRESRSPTQTSPRPSALDDAVRRMQPGAFSPRQQSPAVDPRGQERAGRRGGASSLPSRTPQSSRGAEYLQQLNNSRASSARPTTRPSVRGQLPQGLDSSRSRSGRSAPQARPQSSSSLDLLRSQQQRSRSAVPRSSNYRGPTKSPAASRPRNSPRALSSPAKSRSAKSSRATPSRSSKSQANGSRQKGKK